VRGVATLLAFVLLGGCSSSSKPTAVARAAPRTSAELEARIITKVPAAFVEQPRDAYDTGPSDLAKAIRDDGAPDAGKALRAEGFVRGYQRIWIGPEHAQIIVFIYQFESSSGARQDFARVTRGFDSKPPAGIHKFSMPGLPKDRALGWAGGDKTGAAALVYFTSGVFNVEINCNGPRLPGLQARATALAETQLRRL
jgi:hypothetical protein